MKPIKIKNNELEMYDMYIPHQAVKVYTGTETIVEQHHEENTNINKIINRYRRSGVLPENRQGTYMDVSNVPELHEAKLQMRNALKLYEELPKEITDNFDDIEDFLSTMEQIENDNATNLENAENTGRPPHETEPVQNGGTNTPGTGEDKADPPGELTQKT